MTTNEIVENCATVIKNNVQKIVFAVLAMLIVMHFFSIIAFMLVTANAALSSLLTLPLLIAAFLVMFGLFYGFCALMLLFTRNQYGVIGHLFCGFKNFKRLFQTGVPFILLSIGSCFAAIIISLLAVPGDVTPETVSLDKLSSIVMTATYGAVILTVLLYLPFVFTPFTSFDFTGESVKNCQTRAILVFKNTYKTLFKAFFSICKKNILYFLICIALIVLGSKQKNLAAVAALAVAVASVMVYVIFAKAVVLCAVVYNRFLIEQNPQPQANAQTGQEQTAHDELCAPCGQYAEITESSGSVANIQLEKTETETEYTQNNQADNQGEMEL